MAKLSDGKEIKVDLSKYKRSELVLMNNTDTEDEVLLPIIEKVTGLDQEYLKDIPWLDWRKLMAAIAEAAYGPLELDEKN